MYKPVKFGKDLSNNIRTKLVSAGVKNLKEFGYPSVNKKNILTDIVYRKFFLSMLKDNLGSGASVDMVLKELIKEINEQK